MPYRTYVEKRGGRWRVRYRTGGRGHHPRSAGTFATKWEADRRAHRVAQLLIDGDLDGLVTLLDHAHAAPAPVRPTMVDALLELAAHRVDVGASAQKTYENARRRLGRLAHLDPADVLAEDVRAWVADQAVSRPGARALAPKSVAAYLGAIKLALDLAGRPGALNPARAVRLPAVQAVEVDPPSYRDYLAILQAITPRHRAAAVLIEGTGLRPDVELGQLQVGDLDFANRRIRVARERTKGRTGRRRGRFVPMTRDVEETLLAVLPPPEDRDPGALVVPGFRDQTFRGAMARACRDAGVAHHPPYDLRHRFVSLLRLAGVPMPLVRELAGHRKESTTSDVYSHVLLDEPEWRLQELRQAVARATGLASSDVEKDAHPGPVVREDGGSG